MGIRCRVSTDTKSEFFDVDFMVVPRIGEHVSLPGAEGMQDFRVTRVVHAPSDSAAEPITVEVTDKLL